MGGGGSKTQTVETKSDPWAGAQPYIKEGLANLEGWWDTGGPKVYPNSTVAPFSPEQSLAQQLSTSRALTGNQQMNTAGNMMLDTLGGKYLSAGGPGGMNPAGMILNQGIANATPNLGKFNSYATDKAFSDINPLIYDAERQHMQEAVNTAPLYAGSELQDIATLLGVGADKQTQAQKLLDEYSGKYNSALDLQRQRVADYLALAYGAGGAGGTKTSQQPYYSPSPFGSALGGAATGAALGSYVPGIGTTIGALIGGGIGLLG